MTFSVRGEVGEAEEMRERKRERDREGKDGRKKRILEGQMKKVSVGKWTNDMKVKQMSKLSLKYIEI